MKTNGWFLDQAPNKFKHTAAWCMQEGIKEHQCVIKIAALMARERFKLEKMGLAGKSAVSSPKQIQHWSMINVQ